MGARLRWQTQTQHAPLRPRRRHPPSTKNGHTKQLNTARNTTPSAGGSFRTSKSTHPTQGPSARPPAGQRHCSKRNPLSRGFPSHAHAPDAASTHAFPQPLPRPNTKTPRLSGVR
ncbi:hypothetical protein HMPREF0294_1862 [Corynebacterium glucuronolyticum ATCC 51867]|nr:hypothetical protein HMPREF0294_1862 [Corynebacterium glucuronolyticum ATCC 51867]